MKPIKKEKLIQLDGSEFHRYKMDGNNANETNQYVSTVCIFTSKEEQKAVVIDKVFVRANYNEADYPWGVLELNIYDRNLDPGQLTDTIKPDFSFPIPFVFNSASGPAVQPYQEAELYAWAKIGQTLQVCFRLDKSRQNLPGTISLEFRKRIIDVRA